MKIANIDREILHNIWTTWWISMKFFGKMCLMIILKVTKNQGLILCLEDTIFKKPQEGVKLTPTSHFRIKIIYSKEHLRTATSITTISSSQVFFLWVFPKSKSFHRRSFKKYIFSVNFRKTQKRKTPMMNFS